MENKSESFILFYSNENDKDYQFELWKVDKNFYEEMIKPYKNVLLRKQAFQSDMRIVCVVHFFESAEEIQRKITNICFEFLTIVNDVRFPPSMTSLDLDSGIPLVFNEFVSISELLFNRYNKNSQNESNNFLTPSEIQSELNWIENYEQTRQIETQYAKELQEYRFIQTGAACEEYLYQQNPVLRAQLDPFSIFKEVEASGSQCIQNHLNMAHNSQRAMQGLMKESVEQTPKTHGVCSEKEVDKEAENKRWIKFLKTPERLRKKQVSLDEILEIKEDKVIIKINNTEIPKVIFDDKETWIKYTKATRKLMLSVFTKDTLATHSLSGNPCRNGSKMERKPQLDPAKTNDIVILVSFITDARPSLVRTVITSLGADCAKILKKKNELKEN